MYQIGLKREEYYEGTIPDLRDLLISFEKFLTERKIVGQGSILDYKEFLVKWDKEKEFQKDLEYSDLITFLEENKFDDLNLYKQEDYLNEEYDKVTCIYGEEFFDTIGVKEKKFRNIFMQGEYIIEYQDRMYIDIEINGIRQAYILEIS